MRIRNFSNRTRYIGFGMDISIGCVDSWAISSLGLKAQKCSGLSISKWWGHHGLRSTLQPLETPESKCACSIVVPIAAESPCVSRVPKASFRVL